MAKSEDLRLWELPGYSKHPIPIEPLYDRIFIERDQPDEKAGGIIIIPETVRDGLPSVVGLLRRAGLGAMDTLKNHGIDFVAAAKAGRRVRVVYPALVAARFTWQPEGTEAFSDRQTIIMLNVRDLHASFYAEDRLKEGALSHRMKKNPEGVEFHYLAKTM